MKNLNGLLPIELEDLYLKVKKLRQEVLDTCDQFGYSASQLVSRHFENEIEQFYGKKKLKKIALDSDVDELGSNLEKLSENFKNGCEHTDNDELCPVCKDKENKID